jgi:hypothetical protein
MRSLVVELLEEGIEACWLLPKVLSGGLGGFFLERETHALVTPVLLWPARLDPFEGDPEP